MAEEDIWDEDRWESFLRERDKRLERYMSLLFAFIRVHPLPEPGASQSKWLSLLRDYLLNKGVVPDEYMLSFLFSDETQQEGEAPLTASGNEYVDADPEQDDIDAWIMIPGYNEAKQLATTVLDWATDLPVSMKDSTLVQFCTNIQQIGANLVKGHSLGYEKETMGGNIACVKRSLAAANDALQLMREMRSASYMSEPTYKDFYEQTFELRNRIGIYVQDLRRRFDLGLD